MSESAQANGTSSSSLKPLHQRLLEWYEPEKRAMPWRGLKDPYPVWVSEIMLQQTQVGTVREYFIRFMERFPDVVSLAGAPQQDVLKCWEGLGYYSRARNLQKAAIKVVENGGRWPETLEGWAALPGIGAYTAASISSICQGLYAPVVDGNVIRVFSRYLMWPEDFRKPAQRARMAGWLQPWIEASGNPGDFNQAMMDLGATCCTPRNPACDRCPLRESCRARINNACGEYPWKPPKKKIPTRRVWAFLVENSRGELLFSHRPEEGLLGGLWELPSVEGGDPESPDRLREAFAAATGGSAESIRFEREISHTFTHFHQITRVYRAEGIRSVRVREESLAYAEEKKLPLTTVARRALEGRDG